MNLSSLLSRLAHIEAGVDLDSGLGPLPPHTHDRAAFYAILDAGHSPFTIEAEVAAVTSDKWVYNHGYLFPSGEYLEGVAGSIVRAIVDPPVRQRPQLRGRYLARARR